MKSLFAVLLFVLTACPGFARQAATDQGPKKDMEKAQADAALSAAGCGPAEVHFDVKTDKKQHPSAQPEPGRALVFVFEEDTSGQEPTTRVGLDAKWMGANQIQSYFFFSADPGEHRLCANWQEKYARLTRLGSALVFNAEAGKTYYFRIMITTIYGIRLEPLNSAEGQFLISGDALSISTPKKTEPAKQD